MGAVARKGNDMADTKHGPERVSVDKLHPSPDNPRRISEQDMDRLKRSVQDDPDFMRLRPILAKPDGTIYAGNMRYQAAKALGMEDVWVIFTDDPEAVIRARAVKDNTQLGEWVEEELAEFLSGLADMDTTLDFGALGLGDDLVRTMGLEAEAGLAEFDPESFDGGFGMSKRASEATSGGSGAAGLPKPDYDPEKDESAKTLDDAPGQLEGILQLTEDMLFLGKDADGPWDIPMLREDMLLERLPEPMLCWSDQKTTPPRDDMFYLWNWGIAPATGLPADRAVLCFYTYDHHFENWWSLPHFYTAKVLNAGIRMAVVPDFSIYGGQPRVVNLMNVFRAQWIGRYFQEAGIKVIPRLNWGFAESWDWCFSGIPKNPPVAAICMQTTLSAEWGTKEERVKYAQDGLRAAMEIVQPQTLLNYGGNPAHKIVSEMNLGIPVMNLMNYSGVRRGVAYDKGSPHSDTPTDPSQNPNLIGPGSRLE